jgi:hypothetical protein
MSGPMRYLRASFLASVHEDYEVVVLTDTAPVSVIVRDV